MKIANAGNYSPTILGRLKSPLYYNGTFQKQSLTIGDVIVLDISFYQTFADFKIMLESGVDGVIIRAGQNLWEDFCAKVFMDGAVESGIPFGSYFYYDSRVPPKEQARLWANVLEGYDTKLICWADYEERYGGAYKGWRAFYDFLEWCKTYMPNRKFGVYTGYYYWIDNSPNPITQAGSLNYFAQYPLWLAWYTTDPSIVKIPKPWNKITFWQYTSHGDGKKYGVGSLNVDMNTYDGTFNEFKSEFGLGDVEPPPTGETGMYEVISNNYNMSLRKDRAISADRVATIPMGTTMIADQLAAPTSGGVAGDLWAHVPSITVEGVIYSGWVAIIHNGTIYCTYRDVPTSGTLPTLTVTLEGEGYPTLVIEWKPDA